MARSSTSCVLLVSLALALALCGLEGWKTSARDWGERLSDNGGFFRSLQGDRDRPEKGETDCGEQGAEGQPCNGEGGENSSPPPPQLEWMDGDDHWHPNMDNQVKVYLYVGVRPDSQSAGHFLSGLITHSLNRSIDNMDLYLPPDFSEENSNRRRPPRESGEQGNGGSGGGNGGGGTGGQGNSQGNPTDKIFEGDNRWLRGLQHDHEMIFQLYFVTKQAKVFARYEDRWWWGYSFTYNCFWTGDDTPVDDVRVMDGVGANMTEMLKVRESAITHNLINLSGDAGLVVSTDRSVIDEYGESSAPDSSGEFGSNGEEKYLQPLDAHDWDWQRYLGLVLFATAFLGGMLLSHISAIRQRRRRRKDVWANLASEEGVKELLRTGWAVKGSQMEIFDKSKMGYRDDDSMLIGGFEQKEAMVGTEITVTQDESATVTTPRTQSGLNSRDFLFSSTKSTFAQHVVQTSSSSSGETNEKRKSPTGDNKRFL